VDDFQHFLLRHFYIPLAAVAGAITSLASAKTQKMSRFDLLMTFVAGFSFAIFVTPWIAISWFGIVDTNVRAIAGLTYIFGAGSNILLPVLIGHFKRVVGNGGKDTLR
jgi:hypothetical protein